MTVEKCLRALNRRLAHLEKRIESSDLDLSYDKEEVSALKMAIEAMQGWRVIANRIKDEKCPM